MIVSILIFLVIFSIIVIGHEFGHYAVARRCGIRVREFMIGMGPVLYQRQGRETMFSIRALPIGGACVFAGMEEMYDLDSNPELNQNAGEERNTGSNARPAQTAASESIENLYGESSDQDPHSYLNASVGARMATVLAGPIANFIIGLVIAIITVAFCGTDLPVVNSVMENSAAEEAGIQAGDTITAINGESIHIYREVQLWSMMNYGESLKITYEREGESATVTLTPRYDEEAGRYYIGLVGSGEYLECDPLQVFQYGFYEAEYWLRATVKSIGMIFRGHFSMDDLSGPVGIVQTVDETYEVTKQYGISTTVLTFMSLTTLLSINLGVMNLLPIPGLDGGRFLLLFAEFVRGRKLSAKMEGYITMAGFVALVAIMAIVMVNDIGRLFR